MRIIVEGNPGDLAARPQEALAGLAAAAVLDGADRDAWLAKAAPKPGLPVKLSKEPSYRVVKDASARAVEVYKLAMTLAAGAVDERLQRAAREAARGLLAFTGDHVRKAGTTHLITPEVIRDVTRIIQDHHSAVAAAVWGSQAVTSEDWKLAVALGLVAPTEADPATIAEHLHAFGAMLAHMDQAARTDRYGTTLEDFVSEVRRNPVPQTKVEHRAAEFNAKKGGSLIVGLGNKVGATLGSELIEADAALDKRMRSIIRDATSARFGDAEAAKRLSDLGQAKGFSEDFFEGQYRGTVKQVVSDMGHATDDWARSFHRIAHTESHNAVHEGMKEAWVEQEEAQARDQERAPRGVLAFKLPRPGACDHCQRLHLAGDVPRIYYLDDLEAHGTNAGKRAPDWEAVVGSTHPWCGCPIHKVPGILAMPSGWRSGEPAPSVIGPGGQVVIP